MTKNKSNKPKDQPKNTEIRLRDEQKFVPINWLHTQEFCEYQLFLENIKGIRVGPTKSMTEGKKEHERLEKDFLEKAVPATFSEMIEESKTKTIVTREFRVISKQYRIYGLIDEILLTPLKFIVIDDKPGTKRYLSNIHQVYGYCLAFKEMVQQVDQRPIVAALRTRGTDYIYWDSSFNKNSENEIIKVINHIHGLFSGKERFNSTNNANKCRACRFKMNCDKALF